ncbi:restriction endonuclease subunit S [Halomonas alkalisoli]|uniref:restriction endonuclease subunit S n=1 Tax=Halomonas alkalisoli TaxID=2907158 RepID=UPI001F46C65A|nr:restriction endonuclease subunit S [Halomonas alkalisoli]MCE9681135.1 restriction endonuclease subunit S [Halomonas alkalisoli]
MSFPKYLEYKDSGVEWLGEVPAHWEVPRLKHLARIRNGRDYKDVEVESGGYPVIGSGGEFSRANSYLYKGESVLLGRKGTIDKPLYINGPFWTVDTMFYTELSSRVNGRFLFYYATCFRFDQYSTNTALPSMAQEDLANIQLAAPEPDEQAHIATFLDHETARIDALVEKQGRLIELLKEKRQAVISHAVTKGLDPDAPMKDSGVEWLGEVPAHWDVMKFVRCVRIAEGQVDPKLDEYRQKVLIAPNHIESSTGKIICFETAGEQGAESGKYVCQPGDVVYSKIRPALRKACILNQSALCSADMYPLRPFGELSSQFLLWSILSEPFSRLAVLESERVAMPKINRESLNEIYMAIPPAYEQEKIGRYIAEEIRRLDQLTSIAEDSVGLLAERRSALISAAVTGKIDVRGWQPQAGYSAYVEAVQTEVV